MITAIGTARGKHFNMLKITLRMFELIFEQLQNISLIIHQLPNL